MQRTLGEGGMGTVYLARDRQLDRLVALKVLPESFAAHADLRERFLRETRLAASFSHPNIVPVFAVEEQPGLLAYAMGFVEGETVTERVQRTGPLPVRETVRLLTDVAYALAYAHARGIVHRDIKPDNIMLERESGRALLMDFGIARPMASEPSRGGLTRVGEVVGTPEFMSPEQASGDVVDGRSDLYSLGLVAWYALAGRLAIEGRSTQQVIVAQLTQPVPSLAHVRSGLPSALVDAVDRCVAKLPDARFVDASALVDALEGAGQVGREVPVAVRLLNADLGAMTPLVFGAPALFLWGLRDLVAIGNGNLLVFGAIAMGVLAVRLQQAIHEIRALHEAGFGADALLGHLAAIDDERREQRALRRATASLVAVRHRAVRRAWLVLVLAVAAIVTPILRFNSRHGAIEADLNNWWALLFFGGMLTAAIAGTLLVRSPFRAGLRDVISRSLWLGWPGRVLMRLGGAGRAATVRRAAPEAVAIDRPTEPAQLAAIEARLAALEQWRAAQTRGG